MTLPHQTATLLPIYGDEGSRVHSSRRTSHAGWAEAAKGAPTLSKEQEIEGSLRVAWVDIYKGLGILLVVLGHTLNGSGIQRFIYLFHMPLFFFISGYLHTVQSNFKGFLHKKSVQLLLPYVSFLIVFSPLGFLHSLRHDGGHHLLRDVTFNLLWGGDRLRGLFAVYWFVTCLFFTQQLMNWLLATFRLQFVAACVFLAFGLGYVNSLAFAGFGLPLDANVVVGAVPFFFAGVMWKRIQYDSAWVTVFAATGVLYAMWSIRFHYAISYDMRGAKYGVLLVSPVLAMCCILMIVRISQLIDRRWPAEKLLVSLGAASMGIMFLHQPVRGLPGSTRLLEFNSWVAFLVFVCISYGLTTVLSRFRVTRAFFLGSGRDFSALKTQWLFWARTLFQSSGIVGSARMSPDGEGA